MTLLSNGSTRIGVLRGGLLGLLAIAAVAATGCEQALQLAPTSSVLVLSAPTTSVPLNGTLTVTATLTDSKGAPVENGTMVTFTSTLGNLSPNEVLVGNGRATTTLMAGATSGTATITARSGAIASNSLAVRVGTGTGTGTTNVPGRIMLSVSTGVTSATVVATVFDTMGNAMAGVPVTFTTTSGALGNSVLTTDQLGQAVTTVFGTVDAVVTADVSGIRSSAAVRLGGPATVSVNITFTPTAPVRRQNIVFTAAVTAGGSSPILAQRYEWQFSDGQYITTTGNQTVRAFEAEGVFWVSVRVYTLDGGIGSSRIEFYVD